MECRGPALDGKSRGGMGGRDRDQLVPINKGGRRNMRMEIHATDE